MQRTLVTFSLTLLLKVSVPDIQTRKGTYLTKLLRTAERLGKQKFACELLDYLNAQEPIFHHRRHEVKVKYKCLNEMKSLVYTVLYSFYITKTF